jgi:hypothetical protein
MSDHAWRSAEEICALMPMHTTTSGISARLRELRKRGFSVECRKRAGRTTNIFEYRVTNEPDTDPQINITQWLDEIA